MLLYSRLNLNKHNEIDYSESALDLRLDLTGVTS